MKKAVEKQEEEELATVIRDNRTQPIRALDVVVGDICSLKTGETRSLINDFVLKCFFSLGDLLPADRLLLESTDLKMDESSFTGLLEYFYFKN